MTKRMRTGWMLIGLLGMAVPAYADQVSRTDGFRQPRAMIPSTISMRMLWERLRRSPTQTAACRQRLAAQPIRAAL